MQNSPGNVTELQDIVSLLTSTAQEFLTPAFDSTTRSDAQNSTRANRTAGMDLLNGPYAAWNFASSAAGDLAGDVTKVWVSQFVQM